MKIECTIPPHNPMLGFGKLIACIALLALTFEDKASADGPWTGSAGFSSVQGANQWYYQERPQGGGSIANMVWVSTGGYSSIHGSTGYYLGATGDGWVYWTDTHPGSSNDTIRKWLAPSGGTVSITGHVYKIDTSGGGGVVVSVEKNTSVIWGPKTIAYNDGVGYMTDCDLGGVVVNSGDSISFIVSENGAFGADQTGWDPTITKVASYQASAQFSSVQGQNQWYYQERPQGGGSPTSMVWVSTGGYSSVNGSTGYYQTSDASGWLYQIDTHPGSARDTIRKWVAPAAGTIGITGRLYKINTSGTGGTGSIKAFVEQTTGLTTTTIWGPKILAGNDATGYMMDADLGNVSVASGDSIAFIADDNGIFGADQTGWDPNISFTAPQMPTWVLNTSDTLLTLSIIGNSPAITRLEDAGASHWNWVPDHTTLPLLDKVYLGTSTSPTTPNWSYTTAAVDTSHGMQVTLTFTSVNPSLTLNQVWSAYPGPGPVEEYTYVTNNTGGNATFQYTDVVPANLMVCSDADVTLWRFDRANVRNIGADPNFDTGVLKQLIGTTMTVSSTISNNNNPGSYVLPFVMLDVPSTNHGLYIGYSCDLGLISNSTSGNAHNINTIFQLANSGSMLEGNTGIFPSPKIFLGTYSGDTDCGSNKMKAWFWNNLITPTLKSHTNEPLIEYAANMDTEATANTFYANNPIASWGAELNKEDEGWGDDQNNGVYGYDWNPNAPLATYWPNGMNLGTISHAHGVKLSLYMANTFNQVDLSTYAGVTSEEGALESRYNGSAANFTGPGYDYWRSDIRFEADSDYGSHLGFIAVLDYMIGNHSDFRWENCSSGGTKKSFDLLQRQTFMTVEDSGGGPEQLIGAINFRKANYGNSYMINSVQLKDDNSDWLQGTNKDLWERYYYRNGFLGAWLNGYPGTNGNYQTHTALYANHQRPILRGADVYHILPMPDGTNWDGLEFFNTTLNKGSVVLFKPYSTVGNMPSTIYLKGLMPAGTYSLKFQDRNNLNSSYASVSGSALMSGGAGIAPLSGSVNQNDSEIIWINY